MAVYERKILKAMLEYVPCPNFARVLKKPNLSEWGLSEESVDLLQKEPNAFFLGTVFDRQMDANKAWEIPYLLKERLGHLDVRRISRMKESELVKHLGPNKDRKSLHRFYNLMADCAISASKLLVEKYEGNASNIWRIPKVNIVLDNLLEFKGIKQKLAHMFVRILITYYGVRLTGWKAIDVAVDRHVARVFLRTGLIKVKSGISKVPIGEVKDSVIQKARELFSKYPGALDEPAFSIGREWCNANKAYCDYKGDPCPLTKVCSKKRLHYEVV
jgi:endonuclease-3